MRYELPIKLSPASSNVLEIKYSFLLTQRLLHHSKRARAVSEWDTVEATPQVGSRWDATPGPAGMDASRWDATPGLGAGETPAWSGGDTDRAAGAGPTPRRNRWDEATPGRVSFIQSRLSSPVCTASVHACSCCAFHAVQIPVHGHVVTSFVAIAACNVP